MQSEQISKLRGSDDDDSNRKRKRAANFSEEEILKFLQLLQQKGMIIIRKVNCKDLKTNKIKEAAWREICHCLNSSGSIQRSTDTLKKLWGKLKTEAKQYILNSTQQTHGTDGLSIFNENLVMELVVQLTRCANAGNNGDSDRDVDDNAVWVGEFFQEDTDQEREMQSERMSGKRGSDDDDSNRKRRRSANFSEKEKLKFLQLLQQKGIIIISKVNCKDLKTNKIKEAEWKEICKDLNSSGAVMRSTETLKKLWAKLKSEAKQYISESTQQTQETSGHCIHNENLVMELVVRLTGCGNAGKNGAPDFDSDHDVDETTLDDNSFHKHLNASPTSASPPTVGGEARETTLDDNSFLKLHLKASPSSASPPTDRGEARDNAVWVDEVFKEDLDPEIEHLNERVGPTNTRFNYSFEAKRHTSERANIELENLKIQQQIELHELRIIHEKELFQIKKKILEKELNQDLINLHIQQEKELHGLRMEQKKDLFQIKKKILEKVLKEGDKLDLNIVKSL